MVDGGDAIAVDSSGARADAARERLEAASYAVTVTGGVLTTSFLEPKGERFGGVTPETGGRMAIWTANLPAEGAPEASAN